MKNFVLDPDYTELINLMGSVYKQLTDNVQERVVMINESDPSVKVCLEHKDIVIELPLSSEIFNLATDGVLRQLNKLISDINSTTQKANFSERLGQLKKTEGYATILEEIFSNTYKGDIEGVTSAFNSLSKLVNDYVS